MIAKLGQDLFGDETKKNFSELGVNIDHVFTTNSAPSGVAQITVLNFFFIFFLKKFNFSFLLFLKGRYNKRNELYYCSFW